MTYTHSRRQFVGLGFGVRRMNFSKSYVTAFNNRGVVPTLPVSEIVILFEQQKKSIRGPCIFTELNNRGKTNEKKIIWKNGQFISMYKLQSSFLTKQVQCDISLENAIVYSLYSCQFYASGSKRKETVNIQFS